MAVSVPLVVNRACIICSGDMVVDAVANQGSVTEPATGPAADPTTRTPTNTAVHPTLVSAIASPAHGPTAPVPRAYNNSHLVAGCS